MRRSWEKEQFIDVRHLKTQTNEGKNIGKEYRLFDKCRKEHWERTSILRKRKTLGDTDDV